MGGKDAKQRQPSLPLGNPIHPAGAACVWINGQRGVGQSKVLEVRRDCPSTRRLCARSGFLPKTQRGHSNFPNSGVGQGPTSRTYQSVKDKEESARHGLCRITSPNPQSVRAARKVCSCLAGHEVMWGEVWTLQRLYFSAHNLKCNYSIHNWWGISSAMSLSLWLLAQTHDAFC